MEKLFEEFDSVGYEEWLKKIETDLKGKPLDLLHFEAEKGIEMKSHYHKDEGDFEDISAHFSGNPDWAIREVFNLGRTNSEILEALNRGSNHLGLSYKEASSFQEQSKDIQFEYIGSDISFLNLEDALSCNPPTQSNLNFDVISLNLIRWNWELELEDFKKFYDQHPNHKTVWVAGLNYHRAGSSATQELAFTLSQLNEYVQYLKDEGIALEETYGKTILEISSGNNFLLSIAKTRAIRILVDLLFEAYGLEDRNSSVLLYSETSLRHQCHNEENTNLLRQTAECAAAAIGGADVITVRNTVGSSKYDRLARNIQLILKEETYLNQVQDPAAGSYAIETLTDTLVEKAWDLFKEIESEGGFIESLKAGKIQNDIINYRKSLIEDVKSGKDVLLGVNKYQVFYSEKERAKFQEAIENTGFQGLDHFNLEQEYERSKVKG